jgi:cysteine synthase A
MMPGLGSGIRPELTPDKGLHKILHVTATDCVIACRELARSEAILAGGSSGGVISAVEQISGEIPQGSTVVSLLPDRGERYLDTIFSDEWVRNELGDIAQRRTKTPGET